jgi:hypothetical protein
LRSATARRARSVGSKCRSRVIESRNTPSRQGLPVSDKGGSTAMHIVRRHRKGAQAKCVGARPGAESRAEAYGGILESWESRTVLSCTSRIRTTPAHQRPGAWVVLPAAHASETSAATREPARGGNRSARGQSGSRSGLVVAFQNRVTNRREPVSSEGDHQGEGVPIGETLGSFCPFKRLNPPVAISLRERILLFEEPDALIALVRVCGGLGGRPPGLPGGRTED